MVKARTLNCHDSLFNLQHSILPPAALTHDRLTTNVSMYYMGVLMVQCCFIRKKISHSARAISREMMSRGENTPPPHRRHIRNQLKHQFNSSR